jgi:hypothetical protein
MSSIVIEAGRIRFQKSLYYFIVLKHRTMSTLTNHLLPKRKSGIKVSLSAYKTDICIDYFTASVNFCPARLSPPIMGLHPL